MYYNKTKKKVVICLFIIFLFYLFYVIHTLFYRCLMYLKIYIYTVGTESIQTPLNFLLFVILQPFAKII